MSSTFFYIRGFRIFVTPKFVWSYARIERRILTFKSTTIATFLIVSYDTRIVKLILVPPPGNDPGGLSLQFYRLTRLLNELRRLMVIPTRFELVFSP